jgi:hypothetical protein
VPAEVFFIDGFNAVQKGPLNFRGTTARKARAGSVTMQKNVGRLDACIRGALAIVLFVVAVVFNRSPVISLAAALLALILMGTALTRSCPLYRALHVDSTTPKPQGM